MQDVLIWHWIVEIHFTNDIYFYMRDGYNRVEVKGKEMFNMEAGQLHTVDDAFQIIRDRMKNEL